MLAEHPERATLSRDQLKDLVRVERGRLVARWNRHRRMEASRAGLVTERAERLQQQVRPAGAVELRLCVCGCGCAHVLTRAPAAALRTAAAAARGGGLAGAAAAASAGTGRGRCAAAARQARARADGQLLRAGVPGQRPSCSLARPAPARAHVGLSIFSGGCLGRWDGLVRTRSGPDCGNTAILFCRFVFQRDADLDAGIFFTIYFIVFPIPYFHKCISNRYLWSCLYYPASRWLPSAAGVSNMYPHYHRALPETQQGCS